MNVITFSHQLLKQLKKDSTVIDMTCGNGHDTLFLCENFKKVYAFDIQKVAIEKTKALVDDFDNVMIIHESHSLVDEYVKSCDGAIFNLGYLPQGNKSITTNANTTIKALEKLFVLECQLIVLVVYIGHLEGARESEELENYLCNIKKYDVVKHQVLNRSLAPYIIEIRKQV